MCNVQSFCEKFNLPDISPLVKQDLPASDRCAVVWQVMQLKLPVEKQGEFLRGFCRSSKIPALASFADFLANSLDSRLCNSAMSVISKMEGIEDALTLAMRQACIQNELAGFVTLLDKFGVESVVYSIDSMFPVIGEDMHFALDTLKFEANPVRFTDTVDRYIKENTASRAAKVTALSQMMDRLLLEEESLENQLADISSSSEPGSPVVGGKRPRA